jgi:hypothetical protein
MSQVAWQSSSAGEMDRLWSMIFYLESGLPS